MHYRNGREAQVGDHVVAWTKDGAVVGTVISLDAAEHLVREALVGFLVLQVGDAPLDWGTRSPVAVTGIAGNRGAKAPLGAVLYREQAFACDQLLHAGDAHWKNGEGAAVKPTTRELGLMGR